jgi:hypothetical protein
MRMSERVLLRDRGRLRRERPSTGPCSPLIATVPRLTLSNANRSPLPQLVAHPTDHYAPANPSVDGSNPAICRRSKSRIFVRRPRRVMFYFGASSVRKSVCTVVRQLRGPHLST